LVDYLVEQSAAMKAYMTAVHSVDLLVVLMADSLELLMAGTTADSME